LALLGLAAWRDFATRTIPDAVSLAIAFVGLATRLTDGWAAVGISVGVALLLFACLIPLHYRGLLGGGDLKLLTSVAFGLPPFASYRVLVAVVLAGGVLGIVYLVLRQLVARYRPAPQQPGRRRSTFMRIAAVEAWRIRRRAPLPYGLAIAAGTAFVIGHQGV
jgi:prepilin peptidase CpaA